MPIKPPALLSLPLQIPKYIAKITRTFRPTPDSLTQIRTNNSTSAFPHHVAPTVSRFEDVYYDTTTLDLWNKGMMLRRRTGLWQLFHISGPSSTGSKEVAGRNEVEDELAKVMGWQALRLGTFGAFRGEMSAGLMEVGRWMTVREQWTMGEYGIVVDETDFGCRVGKIECEVASTGETAGGNGKAKIHGEGIEAQMDRFMADRFGGFQEGNEAVMGLDASKLAAFLEQKKR